MLESLDTRQLDGFVTLLGGECPARDWEDPTQFFTRLSGHRSFSAPGDDQRWANLMLRKTAELFLTSLELSKWESLVNKDPSNAWFPFV